MVARIVLLILLLFTQTVYCQKEYSTVNPSYFFLSTYINNSWDFNSGYSNFASSNSIISSKRGIKPAYFWQLCSPSSGEALRKNTTSTNDVLVLQSPVFKPNDTTQIYSFSTSFQFYDYDTTASGNRTYYYVHNRVPNSNLVNESSTPLLLDTVGYVSITATRHANGVDWWVATLVPEYIRTPYINTNNNNFQMPLPVVPKIKEIRTYLVTATGISLQQVLPVFPNQPVVLGLAQPNDSWRIAGTSAWSQFGGSTVSTINSNSYHPLDFYSVVINGQGNKLAFGYMDSTSYHNASKSLQNQYESGIALFEFNNATGVASNGLRVPLLNCNTHMQPTFSPNGRFLYTNYTYGLSEYRGRIGYYQDPAIAWLNNTYPFSANTFDTLYIAQIDVSSHNVANIQNSVYLQPVPMGTYQDYLVPYSARLSMQQYNKIISKFALMPDNKVYMIHTHDSCAVVINNPNAQGAAMNMQYCVFHSNPRPNLVPNIYLSEHAGGHFRNLPSLPLSELVFNSRIAVADTCLGDSTMLSVSTRNDSVFIDSLRWQVQVGGVTYSSTQYTYPIVFPSAGQYTVQLAVHYNTGYSDTSQRVVTILGPTTNFSLGNDTTWCEGDTFMVQADTQRYAVYWSTGDTSSSLAIYTPGIYWVELNDYCFTTRDTLVIDSIIPALVNFGVSDTVLCQGDSLLLNASVAQGLYQWNTGSSDSVWVVHQAGTYQVIASNICGTSQDSVRVRYIAAPSLQLPSSDTSICQGDSVQIAVVGDSLQQVQWHTGLSDTVQVFRSSQTIWVQASNKCGSVSDSLVLHVDTPLQVNLGLDSIVCLGDSVALGVVCSNCSVLWHTGNTTTSYTSYGDEQVWVEAMNSCGVWRDSIHLNRLYAPQVYLGGDTVMCGLTPFWLDASWPKSTYAWQDGSSDSLFQVVASGEYWVVVSNPCAVAGDTLLVDSDFPQALHLPQDTLVCESEQFSYAVPSEHWRNSYTWSTGYEGAEIWISDSGKYVLTVSNACGMVADSMQVRYKAYPRFSLPNDTNLCPEDTLIVYIVQEPKSSIYWSDEVEANPRELRRAGSYWVVQVDSLGCEWTEEIAITSECEGVLYVPNAFSPNGDGINEVFTVEGYNIKQWELKVFNRWGELIYSERQTNYGDLSGWNGTTPRGELAPEGMYVYQLSYVNHQGDFYRKEGSVQLIR